VPGGRYYGGLRGDVDRAETIGIERAKALFGAEHANLQPHSGASANIAADGAFAWPSPVDTVLAMSRCPHGGHLDPRLEGPTSGETWFDIASHDVRRTPSYIDYDEVRSPRPPDSAER